MKHDSPQSYMSLWFTQEHEKTMIDAPFPTTYSLLPSFRDLGFGTQGLLSLGFGVFHNRIEHLALSIWH
jgi:hypothetical protein